jgi:LacI family transcriptional regulator
MVSPMKKALFLADPDTRINQQVALGMAEELQKHAAWSVRLRPDVTSFDELRNVLGESNPDALVMRWSNFSAQMTQFVSNLPIPKVSVAVDWQTAIPAPVVIPDDEAVGRMAARYLLAQGFNHFATLNYDNALPPLRMKVFSRAINRAGKTLASIVLPVVKTVDHAFHTLEGEGQVVHWLRRLPKPCAVFAHSDNPGAQLIEICGRHGLRVPEDIAVLGVDDDPCSATPSFRTLPASMCQTPAWAQRRPA